MPRPHMTPEEMKAVRSFKNWTQADLADFIGGTSKRTVGNYESGFTKIPRGVQLRLDAILNAALAESDAAAKG